MVQRQASASRSFSGRSGLGLQASQARESQTELLNDIFSHGLHAQPLKFQGCKANGACTENFPLMPLYDRARVNWGQLPAWKRNEMGLVAAKPAAHYRWSSSKDGQVLLVRGTLPGSWNEGRRTPWRWEP